ncbi:fungal zn(2)-Cys(6) binuclear cluster domain protein [Fusarium subglutinans]|uniref:Fungal zn(2)-Cys(6) binuclear cluster domain protein n=1 Tax=Gibberella subglutinans TaxID=42677 RepID=A0A8H5P715_GIBSU|nr:fungal zn(2)-Cys(6) binuclear cluster domain protein [Fusarium subglutinans]KAF5591250.1 fungal zn(2)-Cys(6) binuclear cluster domain protein [Fusarium subglutinans]
MVGRMSRKNKQLSQVTGGNQGPSQQNQNGDQQRTRHSSTSVDLSQSALASPSSNSATFEAFDCFSTGTGTGADAGLYGDSTLGSNRSNDFQSGLNFDFNMDHMTLDIIDMDGDSTIHASGGPPQQFPPSPEYSSSSVAASLASATRKIQFDGRQFPHVAALSKIILILEHHVRSKTHSIDEILRVNKACLTDLATIMDQEEYKACRSCHMTVCSVLDLILVLFEGMVQGQAWSHQRNSATTSPILQFGVFELDPEEQVSMTKRILHKEVQRALKIVHEFSKDVRGTGADGQKRLVAQMCTLFLSRGELLLKGLDSGST